MPDDYQRPDGTHHIYCACGHDLGAIDPEKKPQVFRCPECGEVSRLPAPGI